MHIYQTSKHKARELIDKMLVKKAFKGELLSSSELESCRSEADWEPAEKLLERIKKERK